MKRRHINIFILIVFMIISLAGVLNHEIWMDEAHHWLLARDSNNLYDLWKNTRYEGHPLIWNVILFFISRFSTDPLAMQLTHWIISVTAVAILIFYAPFPQSWKILLAFSYFIVFEYTVISRNYSIMLLLFFIFLKLYPNREKKLLLIGVILLLLANTHLFGLILALSIAVILALDFFSKEKPDAKSYLGCCALIAAGVLLSVYQIMPPADSPFKPHISVLSSAQSIERFFTIFLRGFLPVPNMLKYNTWNTNFFSDISRVLGGILSTGICACIFFSLWRNVKAVILFCGFTIPLILVVIILYPASIVQASRHFGMVFIVFIGCLWIIFGEISGKNLYGYQQRFLKVFVPSLLVIQLIAAFMAYYSDLRLPFSESKNVAEYLRRNKLEHYQLISWKVPIPSVSAYTGKKFYLIPEGIEGSFILWQNEKKIRENIAQETLIQSTIAYAQKKKEPCVLITYEKINTLPPSVKLLQAFDKGMVKIENFFVYIVKADQDL